MQAELDQLLGEAGALDGLESVERMACELLVSLGDAQVPPEFGEAFVEALAQSEADGAPNLLAALAQLGTGPMSSAAAAALEDAPPPRLGDLIGRVEACDAALTQDGRAEVVQVRFERPSGEFQLAGVFLEREGPAFGGMVTSPRSEVLAFMPSPGREEPQQIGVAEAKERIEAALALTAELGIAVDRELGVGLPLIALGLTGAADGLPAVEVEEQSPEEGPGPLSVDPGDEDTFLLVERGLLEELEEYVDDEPYADHAAFFAQSLLQWKWSYVDGRLGTWTLDDIEAFMLDHLPRKLPSDDETLAAAPHGVRTFLTFLSDRGSLVGAPLDELIATVGSLEEPFVDAARDPGNWGPAKALVAQMESEGVEPTDQAALDAWMEDFNARPFEERDRILGPPLEGAASAAGKSDARRPQPNKAERRGKRKQARAARRRNR